MLIRALSLLLFSGLAFAAPTFPVLKYSTYLRDSFTPTAITVDSSGSVYVAGNAIIDPATSQTAVLVAKMDPQASQYLYVRYLNGSVGDYANAIAVDAAGNAYIAGSTASPDFPVTSGGNLGTAPTGQADRRSFVAKLNANGEVVFCDLLGGSTMSAALAVAVNGTGQVIVTGMSVSAGFPTTSGAYSVASSASHPYLLELDSTGTKTIFSATGIGGSAMAFDSSGNIFVAGTTTLLDYPTTTGVYQATFPAFQSCFAPCQISFQGSNQYITKVDPTGSKLIYSTAVSGTNNTTNTGLAIDPAGNAYITGYAGSTYPFTVTPPATVTSAGNPFATPALPFLSKLDPLGQKLLFSVPVGGGGVQVDAVGSVYVGGSVGSSQANYFLASSIPALAGVPSPCLPNNQTIFSSAYAAQVDATSGTLLGSQFIGGSQLKASAVALKGSTLWITGATSMPDFMITTAATPTTPTLPAFQGSLAGAYLGAVDFSQPQPPAGTPQIACIVDAADLAPAGPAVRNQLLTIFGTGLGPAEGVSATDNSTPLLAGVNIVFNSGASSVAAPLLYASSTQINFAVPLVTFGNPSAVMGLSVNGVAGPQRLLQLGFAKPSLFLNLAQTYASTNVLGFVAFALNADGSVNSSTNPAALGSALSVFVNGLTPDPQVSNAPLLLFASNGWSVINIAQSTPFVLRVDLLVPSELVNNFSCSSPPPSLCSASLTIFDVYGGSVGQSVTSSDLAFGGVVYVNRTQ
jgi:uncharacterized protein (TIGR03437 family)